MHAARVALVCLAASMGGATRAESPSAEAAQPVKHGGSEAPASPRFSLEGLVMTPAVYDRAAIAALPQSKVTVGSVTYTGVSLWTLLDKAGIITHVGIKNDILREAVTVTASDGYKVIISLGEIDPDFGNQPCLIATQQNGSDFPSGSFAKLVFPNDVKKGRWVANLTALKVSESP
jgi:hypothetical protein